jgi:hypothetical protein
MAMLARAISWTGRCGLLAGRITSLALMIWVSSCHGTPRQAPAKLSEPLVLDPQVDTAAQPLENSRPTPEESRKVVTNAPESSANESARMRQVSFWSMDVGPCPMTGDCRPVWLGIEPVASEVQFLRLNRETAPTDSFAFPFWNDSQNHWNISGSFGKDRPEPSPLHWDLTNQYEHLFADHWFGGGSLDIASSGQTPWDMMGNLTTEASGFFKVAQGQKGVWLVRVGYLLGDERVGPISRVEYTRQITELLQANVHLDWPLSGDVLNGYSLQMWLTLRWPANP